ncbi:MAG: DUF177 domain-containing protein [Deltaproteobacteria bacterium]|nr:DUF177 domain-containing protein [Deltaproteobacteria bacterium]
MKIKIDEITEEGLTLEVTEEGKKLQELKSVERFSIIAPLKGSIGIKRSGVFIDIEGTVSTAASLQCSRCLKKFDFKIASGFTNRLELGSPRAKEKELSREEMDITFFQGEELDTFDILMEQVSLELPIKPLCREDCKGLCHRCGADLNEGPCACCGKDRIDPRFARLKDIKLK